MSGFMWWNYEITDNKLRTELIRMASVPLLNSRPIEITDIDGTDIIDEFKFHSRAFIEDNTITVYVSNFSGESYTNYGFQLDGATITGDIQAIQWTYITGANANASTIVSFMR